MEVGKRVRLVVPTLSGRKGPGTITNLLGPTVELVLHRDGELAECCPHEVAPLRRPRAKAV